MIRKILIALMFALGTLGLSACGGGNGNSSGSATVLPADKLTFNLASQTIPFPNDIAWANPNPAGLNQAGIVDLEGSTSDPATDALYTEIANLKIKGLSPNAPIAVPLDGNSSSALTNLDGNILLIDLTQLLGPCESYKSDQTAYNGCLAGNLMNNPNVDQTAKIESFYQAVKDANGNVLNYAIKIYPITSLIAGDQYVVVLKKGIKSANGALLSATSTVDMLKSDTPLTDPQMEAIRQQYIPLFNLMSQLFLTPKSDILELFTFTTADKTLSLADFAQLAQGGATNVTGISYNASTSDPESITSEYEAINGAAGQFASYSAATSDVTSSFMSTTFFETGFNSFNVTTLATSSPAAESVPAIIIPSGSTDKVVIFQHGLGGDKTNAFALAAKLLPAGYTIIAMDLPDHGDRAATYAANPYNACDTSSSGGCFFTANLPQDRINLYQSAFDMTIMLKDLEAGKFDLDGDGIGDVPNKIYFVSQSLGSITGSVFNKFNNQDITKSVLNVGGANFAAILDETAIQSLQNTVSALGYTKNTVGYMTFLGIAQLLLDPADPVYLARGIKNALVQTAKGDIIVPNISNEVFAKSVYANSSYLPIALDPSQDLSVNNAITSPAASWYQYGITGQYIPHGFMLSDDISSYSGTSIYPIYQAEQTMITNAYKSSQEQLLNYLNN